LFNADTAFAFLSDRPAACLPDPGPFHCSLELFPPRNVVLPPVIDSAEVDTVIAVTDPVTEPADTDEPSVHATDPVTDVTNTDNSTGSSPGNNAGVGDSNDVAHTKLVPPRTLTYLGCMITATGRKLALVQDSRAARAAFVEIDREVAGITIQSFDQDVLVVSGPKGSRTEMAIGKPRTVEDI